MRAFLPQAFSALDIATQTLVATYLGQNIRFKAFEVLLQTRIRITHL